MNLSERSFCSAPLHVELALTSVCQLRCSYCSAMPFTGALVPKDRTLVLLKELCDAKIFSLLLSGGEPTLHPNFFDFLKIVSTNVSEVTTNTNGLRFSQRDFAEEFHRVAPHVIVAVSLDSPDASLNNRQRGKGGDQAIRAIENLCDLKHPVCISTVLTTDNLDTADTLIDRFFPHVKVFRFFPRVPRSHSEVSENALLIGKELEIFFERVRRRSVLMPELRAVLPYKSVRSDSTGLIFQGTDACCCASTKLFIDSQLAAYPCYYSANSDTLLGDLSHQTLAQVWNGDVADKVRQISKVKPLCELSFNENALPHKYVQIA